MSEPRSEIEHRRYEVCWSVSPRGKASRCRDCGALVGSKEVHDEWHASIEAALSGRRPDDG